MMQDDSAMSIILFLPFSLSFFLSFLFQCFRIWTFLARNVEMFSTRYMCLGVLLREIVAITNRAESLSDNIVIFAASILKQCGTNSLAQ